MRRIAFGTIITSMLVANSTGLSTSPFVEQCAGYFGLAAAYTSAGAPCSMSVSSAPEPPNVYFASGSIFGKTFVSDAAASTTGAEPPEVAVAAAEVAAAFVVVVVELLPQPATRPETATTTIAAATPRAERELNDNGLSSRPGARSRPPGKGVG